MQTIDIAIARLIEKRIVASPDRIVGINSEMRLPIRQALEIVHSSYPELCVGLLEEDDLEDFLECTFRTERDSALLTTLRNERNEFPGSDTTPPLILVGIGPKGRGYDGLNRITNEGTEINSSAVAIEWFKMLQHELSEKYSDQSLRIRINLVKVVTDLVANLNLSVEDASAFLESAVYGDSVGDAQRVLWKIGLIPDDALIGSTSIERRLDLNRQLVEDLLNDLDEDGKKIARLKASSSPKVKAFVKYLLKGLEADLEKSEYGAIQDALKSGPGPTPPPRKKTNLLDLLGKSDSPDRGTALHEIDTSLARAMIEDEEVLQVKGTAAGGFVLDVKGDFGSVQQWQDSIAGASSQSVVSPPGQLVATITWNEDATEQQSRYVYQSTYKAILEQFIDADIIQAFFSARESLIKISQLFASKNDHILSLLVASTEVLATAEKYLVTWNQLLSSFAASEQGEIEARVNAGVYLGLIDGQWRRKSSDTDIEDYSVVNQGIEFESVILSPIHPWKIEPLINLAVEIRSKFSEFPNVVRAANWAIDRAIPSFRVLQIAGSSLRFSSMSNGALEFRETLSHSLPQITTPGPLLKRAFRAFNDTHPWSAAGATVALINTPDGGILSKLNDFCEEVFANGVAAVQIRDKRIRGIDYDDSDQFVVISQTVSDIGDWFKVNPVTRDITVVFISDKTGQSSELGQGTHGTIKILLKNQGFDAVTGRQIHVPQLRLAAGESDETVTLLRKVASPGGLPQAATFDLTLSRDSLDGLKTVSESTDWLIVATPAFISSFDIVDDNGHKLFRIAEFDEGLYRYFVYARSIEALSHRVSKLLATLPIHVNDLSKLQEIIDNLTSSLPQKIFEIASNRFGVEEALGLINARAVAEKLVPSRNLVLEISLDNISWSKKWFDSTEKRADLLLVSISPDVKSSEPIRFLVVEAKGVTGDFSAPSVAVEPFTSATEQVEATRALLIELFNQDDEDIIEALQLRTLIEQIATRAGARYLASIDESRDEDFKTYFDHISKLSTSERPKLEVTSVVVTTYLSSMHPIETVKLEEDAFLVSASSDLLQKVLRHEDFELSVPETIAVEVSLDVPSTHVEHSSSVDEVEGGSPVGEEHSGSLMRMGDVQTQGTTDDMVKKVHSILRRHSSEVGQLSTATYVEGPTFISVDFAFAKGAQIAPLERREQDIARDLGLPSVQISNSDFEGKMKILVPRTDRVFPPLLPEVSYPWSESHYLPVRIGQDLSGAEVRIPVSSWPHALVSGTTGSGKTTFLRSVLGQLNSWGESYVNVIVVDGKAETDYFGVATDELFVTEFPEPKLDVNGAIDVLTWLKNYEVPRRKMIMQELARQSKRRVDAKSLFIEATKDGTEPVFKPLVVVIDEFNELMLRGGEAKSEFVDGVTSVAQAARSVLVHLVLATQRPDRSVVPGTIKANLPARIAFRLPATQDSVTILGHAGAEKLLGKGDMLFQLNGEADRRLQSYFF